jgi:MoxR-like ATPase
MSSRGLLLVGEPGTAKSMLSELLSAAISGASTCTIQGTAGSTEDQIKYSWNYALLLAEGPSPRALVRGPMYEAMAHGRLCRFEEVTRVQPEVQDCLISLLSDKVLHVPELDGDDAVVFAARGFNVLATANIRDRGVHEMSSALKRRFNFETVRPISDRKLEIQLVREQTEALLKHAQVEVGLSPDVVELLVTAFADLRNGVTAEGVVVEKPTAVMSSAEAVAVGYAAGLDAHYFGGGEVGGEHIARQLIGTVLKDNPEDGKKLRHYFDVVVKQRAQRHAQWRRVLEARRELER